MHINELLVDPDTMDSVQNEPDTVEDDGIELRYFDDDNISDEMAELLGHLKSAESWGQVRAILSLYVDLGDGGVA